MTVGNMSISAGISETPDDPASSIIGRAPRKAYPDLEIDIDVEDASLALPFDDLSVSLCAALFAAEGLSSDIAGELYIRIVDNDEMQALNRDHRGKDKPTNVLSFQAVETDAMEQAIALAASGGPPLMLGDIIVAAPVVLAEAAEQNKLPVHHFSHLLIHGLLHLLGYDHMEDEEAEIMENKERAVLAGLGIDDPYAANNN